MSKNLWNKFSPLLIPFFWLVGVYLRWRGVFQVPAQYYDIGTYEAWGHILLSKGPADFFATSWTDYLPLPIYFCGWIVRLSTILHTNFGIVFKAVVSLLELILLGGIWQSLKYPHRWLLLPLLILSPALIGDSAYWGQLDTIPSLLTLLSLILTTRFLSHTRCVILAALLFGLAVAFKPIMLITLPIFTVVLLSSSRTIKAAIPFILFGLVSLTVFILPAIPVDTNPFRFLYQKSLEQASTYPYTTINAWNLWSVTDLKNTWPPDNQSVFGLSAHTTGLLLFSAYFIFTLFRWSQSKFDSAHAIRLAGTVLVAFYVLTTRMHERHLFFGLPFLAVASLIEPWVILPSLILTVTFTLNLWGAYEWVNHNQVWPVGPLFIQTISWLNVLVLFYLGFASQAKNHYLVLKNWLLPNYKLLAILLLATILRVSHLGYPTEYIFDEVYHSFTAREYLHNHVEAWEWWTVPPAGVAYEWTHPPVAKYGMVIGMLLFGENSFGWRIGSAIMGVISILGFYNLVMAVFGKKNLALLTALLLSIEGLHLSQSRIGMNDIYLLCFYIWSLYNAIKGRWKLSAILYGLALGSKWSAMYGVVPLAFIYLHSYKLKFTFPTIFSHFLSTLRLLLIATFTYLLTFVPFLNSGHTWAQLWELHRQMWYYHTHLVATHAYQSTPWQWFFSLRPVWYFVDYGEKVANIYAQGNPLVLWLGLVAILALLPLIFRFSYSLFYLLFFAFSLPWLLSPRIMFFYHYLPSATFLVALLAAWLSSVPRWVRILFVVSCVLAFIVMSPIYYGIHMPKQYWDTIFSIFPSWK